MENCMFVMDVHFLRRKRTVIKMDEKKMVRQKLKCATCAHVNKYNDEKPCNICISTMTATKIWNHPEWETPEVISCNKTEKEKEKGGF